MADYRIDVEIYEGKGGRLQKDGDKILYPDVVHEGICAWMYRGDGKQSYQAGHRFSLPRDEALLCPWLRDSLRGVVEALRAGQTLGWRYRGTPYEKVIDPEGITTEYIRCIDPTASGIVIKVIRTRLP